MHVLLYILGITGALALVCLLSTAVGYLFEAWQHGRDIDNDL